MQTISVTPSWKKEILADLVDKLYDPLLHKLWAERENILIEFRRFKRIPEDTDASIYYMGKRYDSLAIHPPIDWKTPRYVDLDQKFFSSMGENINEEIELNNESITISAFLRRLLNICISEADISSILPKSLYSPLLRTPVALTSAEQKKFSMENAIHLATIKQRMVHNLLLR